MEYGVHFPQIKLDSPDWSLDGLITYTQTAEDLGFQYLCANDHLLFNDPWFDGPTVLSTLLSHTAMDLVMVSLPVVRGPIALAKTVGAIDLLSNGRVSLGVVPGSSRADYDAVGIPYEERWARFDESIHTIRALWDPDKTFSGSFYSPKNTTLEPYPAQSGGPPIWVGSWGSDTALSRVAHIGDGWIASGYNATPPDFHSNWEQLKRKLPRVGKDPDEFPNAIATMFYYVTEDHNEATRIIEDYLAPSLGRPANDLADRLPIGTPDQCAETLREYNDAGVQRVFLWPVTDELSQLNRIQEAVIPMVQ